MRSVLPLAVVTAALLGILSAAAVVWLAPVLVTALVALVATRGWRTTVRAMVAFVVALVMLALPTLVASPSFLANRIFEYDYLANLVAPLNAAQIAGIWPTGDFRFTPDAEALTYVLVLLMLIAAGGGVWWAVARRAWELPLYVGGVVVSCSFFFPFSTPWIEGKALATASTALPLAAIACCPLLFARGRRVEGFVLAGLVAGGVLWSNVLQYHEAWLAPRAQLAELAQIGQTHAGQGPALMTEFNPYGARHFLRKLDAEGAAELRIRPIPLRTGQLLQKGGYGGPRRVRPGRNPRLPHACAQALAAREPAALRVRPRLAGAFLRGVAATRDRRHANPRAPAIGRSARSGGGPPV